MFDSIINEAKEKLDLGDKAGSVITSLLGLIINPANGGFSGFIDRFRDAGLSDLADSWISTGDNTPISNEQLESALGEDTIDSVAEQIGVKRENAATALSYLTPRVVDTLTPDGEIPSEATLLSRVKDFLGSYGGAIGTAILGGLGTVGAFASGATDDVSNAATATLDSGKEMLDSNVDRADAAAGGVRVNISNTMNSVRDTTEGDGDDGGILKWLIPLLLLGLAIVLGYMFCGKSTPIANAPTNVNAPASNVKTNVNMPAANVKTDVNTPVAVTNTTTDVNRKLTDVSLPSGTKLQAYPGGIEDQLIKFIESDEYKNGTAESLKEKWFTFDDLNFKFGTTELVPESKRQLDNIVAILKAFPNVKIKIGGYSDKKGDDAANKKLSGDRAKAVKAALEKAGVGAQVPEAEGYGEEFAKVPETAGDEERQVDRKTSVRLLK